MIQKEKVRHQIGIETERDWRRKIRPPTIAFTRCEYISLLIKEILISEKRIKVCSLGLETVEALLKSSKRSLFER